jgi:hypothetical protein
VAASGGDLVRRGDCVPIRSQVFLGERFGVAGVRIECEYECRPLPHDPHAGVRVPVDASFVTFGALEPCPFCKRA